MKHKHPVTKHCSVSAHMIVLTTSGDTSYLLLVASGDLAIRASTRLDQMAYPKKLLRPVELLSISN